MAGTLVRFIAQKIRHPRTKNWIETMYMADEGENSQPKIYWHGTFADNNVIEPRHLSSQAISAIQNSLTIDGTQIAPNSIKTEHIFDGQVTTSDLDNSAVTTAKLRDGAVTTLKINDESVTEAKLSPNVKNNLKGSVKNGILKFPEWD